MCGFVIAYFVMGTTRDQNTHLLVMTRFVSWLCAWDMMTLTIGFVVHKCYCGFRLLLSTCVTNLNIFYVFILVVLEL